MRNKNIQQKAVQNSEKLSTKNMQPKKIKTITAKPDLYKNLSKDNPKHAKVFRFIDEYCIDLNGTQAAIRAGYSPSTADVRASELVGNSKVKKLIDEKLAEVAQRNGIDQDYVLQSLRMVAEAKVSALSQVHINCCRHCWHPEFLYQYTPHEFREALEAHDNNEKAKQLINKEYAPKPFNEQGGATFKRNLKPNPDCVECCGSGITRIVLNDTRELSEKDLYLYDGAEFSKDGMKVKHLSREGAIDKLAKHTGFYDKDNKVEVTSTLDKDALETRFWTKLEEARARQEQINLERGLEDE